MTTPAAISPGTPGRARVDGAWRPAEFDSAINGGFLKVRLPGRNGGRIRTVSAKDFEVLTMAGDDKAIRHTAGGTK